MKQIIVKGLCDFNSYLVKLLYAVECILRKLAGLFGIELAPLLVPLERRLQTLAALGWIFMFVFSGTVGIILCVFLLRTDYYWIPLIYLIMLARDREACNRGAYPKRWFRSCRWFQYLRDYFPIKLVKTIDLDPKRNYLMISYPHGLLATGPFVSFATDACGFPNLFPGMSANLLSLDGNFLFPIFREFYMWLGMCSVSSSSINYLLDPKNGTGKCSVLILGGAAEALNCHADSGEYRIVLKDRKGFIKLAMKHGSPLVPVFSFGEINLYEQLSNPKGGKIRDWQDWLRVRLGFAPAVFKGRGFFQYTFGILPRRSPITVVVGKPIEVAKNINPSYEDINKIHKQFTQNLIELFENEKHKYLDDPEQSTLIIE